MKRFLLVVIIIIWFSLFGLPAFASGPDFIGVEMPDDMDIEELTENILVLVNAISNEQPREITPEDIDFFLAYRIFIDTDIFELNVNTFSELNNVLNETSDHIYEIPIFLENGDVYVANLQIRLPLRDDVRHLLTQDQIDEHERTVGKWVVSAIFQYLAWDVPFVDYYEIVSDVIEETGSLPIFVGSLQYFVRAVAIFPDESGNIGKLIPLSPLNVNWSGLRGFRDKFDQNGWLDYNEIKNYITRNPENIDPNLTGGAVQNGFNNTSINNNNLLIWIRVASLIVVSSTLLILFYFRMRNHKG